MINVTWPTVLRNIPFKVSMCQKIQFLQKNNPNFLNSIVMIMWRPWDLGGWLWWGGGGDDGEGSDDCDVVAVSGGDDDDDVLIMGGLEGALPVWMRSPPSVDD